MHVLCGRRKLPGVSNSIVHDADGLIEFHSSNVIDISSLMDW